MVREMVSDPALAEDLTQDALEIGLRHDVGTVGNIRRWFRGVVKNLLRQSYRGQIRREQREQRVAMERDDFDPPMHELMERVEIQQQVARAVLKLPLEHRRLLILRYYEQHSVAQIAEALGISENAAGLRIHRAKAMLRSQLQSSIGSDWRMLAIPISAGVTKVSLATATTSVLAMNKFAKVIAILIVGLICSVPFWPVSDEDSAEVGLDLAASASGETPKASQFENSASDSSPGFTPSTPARTEARSGYALSLVGPNQEPVVDAEVEVHLAGNWVKFQNLSTYPNPFSPPRYQILSGRTDEHGSAFISHDDPSLSGYVFAKKSGYVLRGFPVVELGKLESSVVDMGALEMNSDVGHCWLQFFDNSGMPVAGLEVNCIFEDAANRADGKFADSGLILFQTSITDEMGMVYFGSMLLGKANLHLRTRKHCHWSMSMDLLPQKPHQPLRVEISRGESIHLRVVDQNGTLVPNAGIHYTTNAWHEQFREMTPGTTLWRGNTDEDGEFLLEGLVEGQGHMVAAIHGNAWVDSRKMEVGDEIILQLPKMAEWSGRFLLEDGAPAAGANLAVIDFHRRRNTPDHIVELDQDGRFRIQLPHGSYLFEAIHDRGAFQSSEPLLLEGDQKSKAITIPNGPTLELIAIDAETQEPVSDVTAYFPRVQEHIASRDPENWSTYFRSFRSKEIHATFDGKFSTRKLIPGTHSLRVEAPGFALQDLTLTMRHDQPTSQVIEFSPITSLELTAVDASGVAQPNWTLMLVPEGSEPTWHLGPGEFHKTSFRNYTDQNGVANFDRLSEGVWRIESGINANKGWVFGKVTLETGKNTHTFVLPPSLTVQFQLYAGEQPIEGADVDLRWVFPEVRGGYQNFRLSAKSDQSGIAEIDSIRPGNYLMDVRVPGLLPLRQEITLNQDGQKIPIHYQGYAVEGTVTEMAPHTKVVLFQITDSSLWSDDIPWDLSRKFAYRDGIPSNNQTGGRYTKVSPDEMGRFSFPQVPDGEYYLFVIVENSVPPTPIPLQVDGADEIGLQLAPPPSCGLKVRTTGLNQLQRMQPKARILAWAKYQDRARYVIGQFRKDDSMLFRNVHPGECIITFELRAPGSNSNKKTMERSVTFITDDILELAVDLEDFR